MYYMERPMGANCIKFGFSSLCSPEIMANGGDEMLSELYGGFPVDPDGIDNVPTDLCM